MKLIRAYVHSFGKLKDFTYDFNDGLNVFKQDNGWGKTTFASFLKSVFYGLKDSKRSILENERIKYKPWNSVERFGGYVEFERNGNQYKIERYFGNKEAEDSVKLIDLKTGRVHDNPADIGKRIFEIDEDGFFSTTYFSQKDIQVKSNTSITAKFNAVCEVQDSKGFDSALATLEERSKKYKQRGDKGLIAETQRAIFDINDKIDQANKSIMTLNLLKDNIALLEKDTLELKSEINDITKKEQSAGRYEANKVKKEHYDRLISQRNFVADKKQNLSIKLGGKNVSENEIDTYLKCYSEVENITAKEQQLGLEIESYKSIVPQKSAKKLILFSLLFVSVLALILGVVFAVVFGFINALTIVSFAFAIVSFVALVCYYLLFNKKALNGKNNEVLLAKKNEFLQYQNIKSEYVERLNQFVKGFYINAISLGDALIKIKQAVIEDKMLDAELEKLTEEINRYESAKNFVIEDKTENNLSKLQEIRAQLQYKYDEKMRELLKKQASLRYYEEIAESLPDLESKKYELAQNLATYKEELEIVNYTIQFLKKADENLKTKYRAPLQSSLNKYLNLITLSNVKAKIDIDLNVTVEENGAEYSTDYFSKGYQNLFEICKRFALADVLFTAEKPFIMLDDPFYNLDDKKVDGAIELVKKLSREYQIIYFVCHESRV